MFKTAAESATIIMLLIGLSACNGGSDYSAISFSAINPDNGVITKITNINHSKESFPPVTYNNNAVLNSSSIKSIDEAESFSNVVIADDSSGEYGSALWVFNGKDWIKQTGGAGQPLTVHKLYGSPTQSSIILKSKSGASGLFSNPHEDLWIYDGITWSKQTGGENQPSEVDEIYGKPTLFSIVLKAKSVSGKTHNDILWVYDGKNWSQQTGGVGQPSIVKQIERWPTSKTITLIDTDSVLWFYNGIVWQRFSGGKNQPVSVENMYGRHVGMNFIVVKDKLRQLWVYNGKVWNKGYGLDKKHVTVDYVANIVTPEFIAIKDNNEQLWVYNGKSWIKQTGGISQPKSLENFVGFQYSNSMVIKDRDDNLWVYSGKSWSQQSGKAGQPQSIDRIFGNPTAQSIVLRDGGPKQNLWVYDGKTWSQQTGLPTQPKAVNSAFMVHQRELQQ